MITNLYTALLVILYIIMSFTVIWGRIKNQISLGAGKSNEIIHLISAHNNFSNYVPIFLFCLYLLEKSNLPSWAIHTLGACFLTGRLIHFLTLQKKRHNFLFRRSGMIMTLTPLLICSLLLLITYFSK